MAKFVFNKETGTLDVQNPDIQTKIEVKEESVSMPEKAESVSIVKEAEKPNTVDEEEAQVIFKKFSDLSIMRIDDQATGKWLCYFAGYALDISFNMEELKGPHATKKIEAALEGLNKLFRKIILDQVVGE